MKNTIELNELSLLIKDDVNWASVFRIIRDLGPQLNENQLRFLKARVIEKSIAGLSSNITWHDLVAYDHKFGDDITIETKFQQFSLKTKGKQENTKTTEVKLTNTLGTENNTRVYEPTFDFLMVVDLASAALIKGSDIILRPVSDGFMGKCPKDKLVFITEQDKYSLGDPTSVVLFKELLDKEIESLIKLYITDEK